MYTISISYTLPSENITIQREIESKKPFTEQEFNDFEDSVRKSFRKALRNKGFSINDLEENRQELLDGKEDLITVTFSLTDPI